MGYKLSQSPGLNLILSDRNLDFLCHIGDKATQPVYMQAHFPREQLLSISYIRPNKDDYGRKGVWNHTIIFSLKGYQNLLQSLLEKYFIRDAGKPPVLEAIQL